MHTERPSRRARRLLLAPALIAALACTIAAAHAAPAGASRAIDIDRSIFTATGVVTLNASITCNMSLTFQTDGLIEKQSIAQQYTVSGSLSSCTGLATSGSVLSPRPPFYYTHFSGTLPNITALTFSIGDGSVPIGISLNSLCGVPLYGGSTAPRLAGVAFTFASGRMTSVDFSASGRLARHTGSAICPADLTIRGRLTAFPGGAPSVTLF